MGEALSGLVGNNWGAMKGKEKALVACFLWEQMLFCGTAIRG